MAETKDYYAILQVDPFAEPEAIRAAYRRLALEYHPDVNDAPEATVQMQEVNEAYAVLGDPDAREAYDREQGVRRHEEPTVTCSNCMRPIEFPETPCFFEEQAVCPDCYVALAVAYQKAPIRPRGEQDWVPPRRISKGTDFSGDTGLVVIAGILALIVLGVGLSSIQSELSPEAQARRTSGYSPSSSSPEHSGPRSAEPEMGRFLEVFVLYVLPFVVPVMIILGIHLRWRAWQREKGSMGRRRRWPSKRKLALDVIQPAAWLFLGLSMVCYFSSFLVNLNSASATHEDDFGAIVGCSCLVFFILGCLLLVAAKSLISSSKPCQNLVGSSARCKRCDWSLAGNTTGRCFRCGAPFHQVQDDAHGSSAPPDTNSSTAPSEQDPH
jgi:hypothetical protein